MKQGEEETTVGALSDPLQSLCREALAARKMAYAPYSKFFVGKNIERS